MAVPRPIPVAAVRAGDLRVRPAADRLRQRSRHLQSVHYLQYTNAHVLIVIRFQRYQVSKYSRWVKIFLSITVKRKF
jgi:hypothetical protein